jgi:hypothetical protein
LNSSFLAFWLTAFFSGSAWALGLGEIVVQSSLGKPFHASIKVLDAPKDIQSECFDLKTGNDAGLPSAANARIRLETRDGETTLFISTSQTINDPILQVTVSAGCVDRLQREYVVLLDPPASHPATAVAEASPSSDFSQPSRKLTRVSRSSHTLTRHATHRARAFKKPTQVAATSPRPLVSKPVDSHLVLSGSHSQAAAPETAALRLDGANKTKLTPPQPALTPTELSDEHTSLSHRLAYLQAQLTALQKRNDELEARGRPVKTTLPPPPPKLKTADETPPWWQFLIGLGFPAGGLALFFGMRAYNRRSKLAPRHGPKTAMPFLVTLGETALGNPVTMTTDSPAAVALTEAESAAIFSQSISAYGTEVNEDILDQAEVYVAHGHASLAIHLLQEHVREAPTESPVPWLLLLDLLTREGPESEYRATCLACKKYFNINLTVAPAVPLMLGGASLEAYPHVIAQLQTLWGTRESVAFLADLVYDRRDGTRLGFDPGAYREIMLLRAMAEKTVYAPQPASLSLPIAPNPPTKNPMGARAEPVREEPTFFSAYLDIEQSPASELKLVSEPMADSAPRLSPAPEDALTPPLLVHDTTIQDMIMKEDILEKAQHYVTNDQTEQAIHLLQQRVREAPTVSPGPWLLLLDLLASAGLQTQYQAVSIECQSLFNINLSAHPADPDILGESSLEAYPHVMAQLQTVWNTPEAEDFLSNLIYDQRGGIRQGFNPDAYCEILLLRTLAEATMGAAQNA